MAGTKIAAPIFPTGTFPSIYETDLQGSFRSVLDVTARNAISSYRRTDGMIVYVLASTTYYQLVGGITNGDWQVWNPSGANGFYNQLTHAAFDALYIINNLKPGAWYNIIDFETHYLIGITPYTGTIESIVVHALSDTEISPIAYSLNFPDDILQYSPITAPAYPKGQILYRKDTINNLSTYYDWRSVKFRRWEVTSGNFDYLAFTTTGFGSFDFYTFGNINIIGGSPVLADTGGFNNGGLCKNIELHPNVNNTITGVSCEDIVIKNDSADINILANNTNIDIDRYNNFINIYDNNNAINIGNNSIIITIGNNNVNIDIKKIGNTIEIGNFCRNIKIENEVSYVTIGNLCESIFIDNYLGFYSVNTTIGNTCKNLNLNKFFDKGLGGIITINSLVENKESNLVTNTFEKELDLTSGLIYSGTTLTFNTAWWAGIWVPTHSTPGTYIISNITHTLIYTIKDGTRIKIKPPTGIIIQINGTSVSTAVADDIVLENISGTHLVSGTDNEWIEFECKNGIWFQYAAGSYY